MAQSVEKGRHTAALFQKVIRAVEKNGIKNRAPLPILSHLNSSRKRKSDELLRSASSYIPSDFHSLYLETMSNKQPNILVVDGDTALLETFSKYIPYPIRTCGAFAQASEEMRSAQADIVIVGENLTEGSHLDLVRALAREFPRSSYVIVSSQTDEKHLLNALRAGVCDYLSTPVSSAALEAALKRCTDRCFVQKNRLFDDRNLHSLTLSLQLPTSEAAILPAVGAVIDLARGFLKDRDLKGLELVLNEALRNAYEHGNLGVTFEEKSGLCESGTFEDELARRSALPGNAGKKISVLAEISPELLRCTITDEGEGFDPTAIPQSGSDPSSIDPNGRGVAMIRRYFDRVEYRNNGSQIILDKKLR